MQLILKVTKNRTTVTKKWHLIRLLNLQMLRQQVATPAVLATKPTFS